MLAIQPPNQQRNSKALPVLSRLPSAVRGKRCDRCDASIDELSVREWRYFHRRRFPTHENSVMDANTDDGECYYQGLQWGFARLQCFTIVLISMETERVRDGLILILGHLDRMA